jgi:Na+/phosphate symporter
MIIFGTLRERRVIMAEERFFEEQADILAPIIDNLLTMRRAARDAFNRHSREKLQDLQNLQTMVSLDIAAASRQVRSLTARKPAAAQKSFLRLEAVLNHLEEINASLGGLADPIHKKISGAVLFSDKAVAQSNHLFDQHGGMIRSLLDIVRTDNEFLKTYVKNEARSLVQATADYATEHQDRLIEGLCTPQAAPIFLDILNAMRVLGQTEIAVAQVMSESP